MLFRSKKSQEKSRHVNFKLLAFVFFLLLMPLLAFSQANINTRETGFRLIKNNAIKVDVHSACQVVTNSSATSEYFIPTKTAGEWTAFRNAVTRISDLSVSTCLVCAGGYYLVDNVCVAAGNGYYSPVDDNDRYLCPAGMYCVGASPAGTCCPNGTYRIDVGGPSLASCTSCSSEIGRASCRERV